MLNATVVGNIGRDAEVREVGGGQVTEWSVAVNRKARGGDETAWVRCSLWGDRGTRLAQYLTKGKRVVVTGELWPREYQASDGTTRTSIDLRVSDVEFGANRQDEQPQATQYQAATYQQEGTAGTEALSDVFADEIPF